MSERAIADIAIINPPLTRTPKPGEQISFVSMSGVCESGGITDSSDLPFYAVSSGFTRFQNGDVLFAKITPCMENGKGALAENLTGGVGCGSTEFHVLRATQASTPAYLYQLMQWKLTRQTAEVFMSGSAGQQRVQSDFFRRYKVYAPALPIQKKIATILSGIDTAIEKTETLIAKYQQIKAGLMYDLFTRGVLPNGQLRPPREQAPELYQETAIGWIPKEWRILNCSAVLDSIADGPFGSNLKTEHYVVDPGVRVVRLQNVAEYQYNDTDRAFVSDRHAAYLVRNKVVGGDVLIAGLGEERYPVGRACTYPESLPPAINKADCFRARCIAELMHNKFFMLFLNSELARQQIRRYEQGVTRPRINTGNLKRLAVCVPELTEQATFISKFDSAQAAIRTQQAIVENLKSQKSGLMHDLLTGKVPVKVEEPEVGYG